MDDPTNEDRAEWALAAVDAFAAVTNMDACETTETIANDLLANLMHLADSRCFELSIDRARMHYDAETQEATPGN